LDDAINISSNKGEMQLMKNPSAALDTDMSLLTCGFCEKMFLSNPVLDLHLKNEHGEGRIMGIFETASEELAESIVETGSIKDDTGSDLLRKGW
jgi:hypothetical protein